GVVGERVAVARVFPTIARDFVGSADTARGKHDSFCSKQQEPASFPFVSKCAGDAISIFEQADQSAFHMHSDALVEAVIRTRADHLEAGPIANVSQSRVFVSPEVALQDLSILSSIEHGAPRFQFPNTGRCFFSV